MFISYLLKLCCSTHNSVTLNFINDAFGRINGQKVSILLLLSPGMYLHSEIERLVYLYLGFAEYKWQLGEGLSTGIFSTTVSTCFKLDKSPQNSSGGRGLDLAQLWLCRDSRLISLLNPSPGSAIPSLIYPDQLFFKYTLDMQGFLSVLYILI